MTVATPSATLREDILRMAPVWCVVSATALFALLGMRHFAEGHLRQAIVSTPDACAYAEVHLTRGRQLMAQLREQGGTRILETLRPEEASLGILKDSPIVTEARQSFVTARNLCPSNVEVLSYLATIEWYAGDRATCYHYLAEYLVSQNRLEEAEVNFRIALDAEPDHAAALTGLAQALRRQGRTAEALDLLLPRADSLQETVDGRLALGLVFAARGESLRAWDLLGSVLDAFPGDSELMRVYTQVARTLGRQAEGAETLMAVDQAGRRLSPILFHHAAILYSDLADLPNEERALARALDLNPTNVALWVSYAIVLHRQNKGAAAQDAIRRASDIDRQYVLQRLADAGITNR